MVSKLASQDRPRGQERHEVWEVRVHQAPRDNGSEIDGVLSRADPAVELWVIPRVAHPRWCHGGTRTHRRGEAVKKVHERELADARIRSSGQQGGQCIVADTHDGDTRGVEFLAELDEIEDATEVEGPSAGDGLAGQNLSGDEAEVDVMSRAMLGEGFASTSKIAGQDGEAGMQEGRDPRGLCDGSFAFGMDEQDDRPWRRRVAKGRGWRAVPKEAGEDDAGLGHDAPFLRLSNRGISTIPGAWGEVGGGQRGWGREFLDPKGYGREVIRRLRGWQACHGAQGGGTGPIHDRGCRWDPGSIGITQQT